MDHANIFLIIAGTYTPLCVILLDRDTATVALSIVWIGAMLGLLSRILFLNAPRWVYVPMYVALGWVAVGYIGQLYDAGGATVVALIGAGGICYTVGAVFYGFKWPGPSARYFGFHEIFHSLTVAGFVCHYVAVALAVFANLRPCACTLLLSALLVPAHLAQVLGQRAVDHDDAHSHDERRQEAPESGADLVELGIEGGHGDYPASQ